MKDLQFDSKLVLFSEKEWDLYFNPIVNWSRRAVLLTFIYILNKYESIINPICKRFRLLT